MTYTDFLCALDDLLAIFIKCKMFCERRVLVKRCEPHLTYYQNSSKFQNYCRTFLVDVRLTSINTVFKRADFAFID